MEKIRQEIKNLVSDVSSKNRIDTHSKRAKHILRLIEDAQKLFDIDEQERVHILANFAVASEKLKMAKELIDLPNDANSLVVENLEKALDFLKEMNHEIKHDEEILKELESLTK